MTSPKTKTRKDVLVKPLEQHIHKLRILFELSDLGGFLKSILVAHVVHELAFDQFAECLSVEEGGVFAHVLVDASWFEVELF